MKEEIRKAILSLVMPNIPVASTWAKVKSVTDQVCTVTIDELDIENILLGFYKSGVIVYPAVDSDVLVLFFNNSKTNGVVVYAKETTKVELFGDAFGGIGLTEKIAERLERLENVVEANQNKYNAHLALYNVHVHTGGTISGSTGTAPPDTGNISTETVTPKTTQAYISNDKIKHGEG